MARASNAQSLQCYEDFLMIYWPTKPAAAVRDLNADWGPTLAKLGDPTIVNSVWTRLSGDAGIITTGISADGRKTGARVSGGTGGTTTIFRNTVTLSDSKVEVEDVYLKVRA